jgi:hypothetical protein
MASVIIKDDNSFTSKLKTIDTVDLDISEGIKDLEITDKSYLTSNIVSTDYSIVNLTDLSAKVALEYTLPFRVRFINIGIEGYGPNNPAPIGIAVIGLNNYIL